MCNFRIKMMEKVVFIRIVTHTQTEIKPKSMSGTSWTDRTDIEDDAKKFTREEAVTHFAMFLLSFIASHHLAYKGGKYPNEESFFNEFLTFFVETIGIDKNNILHDQFRTYIWKHGYETFFDDFSLWYMHYITLFDQEVPRGTVMRDYQQIIEQNIPTLFTEWHVIVILQAMCVVALNEIDAKT